MFDTGTRVMVLDSSFKGKTGPKKGSVGYSMSLDLFGSGSVFDSEMFWFITLHQVFFVRYGFEKKKRNESKFFINIFPYVTLNDSSKTKNLSDLVDSRLKDVCVFNSENKHLYDKIRYTVTSQFGKKHVHTGILAPMPHRFENIIKEEPHNFAAWIECFAKSKSFYTVLSRMINNFGKVSKVLNAGDLTTLKHVIDNASEKDAWLDAAKDNPDMRRNIVKTIQKVRIIGDRQKYTKMRKNQKDWINGNPIAGSLSSEIRTMRLLIPHLYGRIGHENLKLVYDRNNDKGIRRKVEYMTDMSNRLVSLSRIFEGGAKVCQLIQTYNGR